MKKPELNNDQTNDGDQLGLFAGTAKRADGKKFKARALGKTQQKLLIDGLDCLPGQMDLFGGGGCDLTNES